MWRITSDHLHSAQMQTYATKHLCIERPVCSDIHLCYLHNTTTAPSSREKKWYNEGILFFSTWEIAMPNERYNCGNAFIMMIFAVASNNKLSHVCDVKNILLEIRSFSEYHKCTILGVHATWVHAIIRHATPWRVNRTHVRPWNKNIFEGIYARMRLAGDARASTSKPTTEFAGSFSITLERVCVCARERKGERERYREKELWMIAARVGRIRKLELNWYFAHVSGRQLAIWMRRNRWRLSGWYATVAAPESQCVWNELLNCQKFGEHVSKWGNDDFLSQWILAILAFNTHSQ